MNTFLVFKLIPDGINWINLLNAINLGPMTLKSVFFLLYLWTCVQIFNGDTSFDTTQRESLFIRKATDHSRLVFEIGFAAL